MNKTISYSKIKSFAVALVIAIAFFVSFDTPDTYEAVFSSSFVEAFFKLFEFVGGMIAGKGFIITVYTLAFTYIINRFMGENSNEPIFSRVEGDRILSGFLAVMYVGGKAFSFNDSLSSIWSPKFNLIKALILYLGFFYFYLFVIRALYFIFEHRNELKADVWRFLPAWLKRAYVARPFFTSWVIIFLSWLIHLICRFPAAMSDDNWRQLNYFYGKEVFTKAQPIFHTWITGIFVDVSVKLFGTGNPGIFLYVLFQALLMSAVLAWTVAMMKKWNTPAWYKLIVLFIYCVTPYFTGNAAWAIKDYPHMMGFLAWILCVIKIVLEKKACLSLKNDLKLILIWTISVVFMSLFRKNGLYIYCVTAAVLFIVLVRSVIKDRLKAVMSALVVLFLPLVIVFLIESIIVAAFNVQNDTIKEMLSLPIQQTVRYYHYYSDEITPDEQEAIAKVWNYDSLYDDFDTVSADNAKADYIESSFSDLIGYFRVWFLMFFKHPMCYIEATWNQNYYIFMPDFDNVVYNESCDYGKGVASTEFLEYINIHVPEAMQGIPIVICSLYRMLNRFPIIGMLNNLAFYMLVFLSISLFMRRKKLSYYKLVMIPVWMCFAFVILAPMIKNQPRYSWGIIYAMPVIVAMYMHLIDKQRGQNEQ